MPTAQPTHPKFPDSLQRFWAAWTSRRALGSPTVVAAPTSHAYVVWETVSLVSSSTPATGPVIRTYATASMYSGERTFRPSILMFHRRRLKDLTAGFGATDSKSKLL